jgi:hypothetical protein
MPIGPRQSTPAGGSESDTGSRARGRDVITVASFAFVEPVHADSTVGTLIARAGMRPSRCARGPGIARVHRRACVFSSLRRSVRDKRT